VRVAARILFLFTAVLGSGCASVQLENVVRYTPDAFSRRVAAVHAAHDSAGRPHDGYVVRPQDELEIRLVRADGTRMPVVLRLGSSPLTLLHDVTAARLRFGLVRALGSIDVAGSADPVTIDTTFPNGATWGRIRAAFAGRTVACSGGTCSIEAALRPGVETFVAPGDRLFLQRSLVAVVPLAGDAPVITTEPFDVVVDPNGWLQVPLLARVSFSEIAISGEQQQTLNGQVATPEMRRAGAHIENSYARVRVWAPEWTGSARRSLEEVADCMSVATILPEQTACVPDVDEKPWTLPADFVARCRAAGVDAQFRVCPEVATAVHYRFAPAELTWTLVDEDGRRLVVPYRHGLTVEAAARERYPELCGRELVQPGFGTSSAYVTVLPDPLGDEKFRFWLRVDHRRRRDDDPLLLPNDTVFVDRTWPARVWPAGGAR
jgi:hypothetical protein